MTKFNFNLKYKQSFFAAQNKKVSLSFFI